MLTDVNQVSRGILNASTDTFKRLKEFLKIRYISSIVTRFNDENKSSFADY